MKSAALMVGQKSQYLVFSLLLAASSPLMAQTVKSTRGVTASAAQPIAVAQFRAQYDTMMSNFQRLATHQGNANALRMATEGRMAMAQLTDAQLQNVFPTRIPDLAAGVVATEFAALKSERARLKSLPFPTAEGVDSHCSAVDTSASTRYTQLIAKETTNSILAAAAWVCTETLLGENGAATCIPFAVAADVANGLFDTSAWCSGEQTSNEVDANYTRLEHLHTDLTNAISNDNANKTAIINNDNANATSIINNDNANKTTLIAAGTTNTTTIVNNDNTNKTAVIVAATANTTTITNAITTATTTLSDLALRLHIEAALANESADSVVLFQTPKSVGGYLELVRSIVSQTIANVIKTGSKVGDAQAKFAKGDTYLAAGQFKSAYAAYQDAYKQSGK